MCDLCCLYELQNSIWCMHIRTVLIRQWLCESVSSVQCTVCVCFVHMFVCCV